MAVAAKADATACLFQVKFTFLAHLLHVFNGANILPDLHILPKAAYPALWVPDPETLGILATALPVPQDSAECIIPEYLVIPWAYLLFLDKLACTNQTISNLIGAVKTAGKVYDAPSNTALEFSRL